VKEARPGRAQQNWLLSLLPAFPLVLLALRLWYLSRQDLPTMLLLVQYVSPFGLISALVITLIWAVPAVVLPLRALGGLLLVSARDPLDAGRSLLAVTVLRMPDWVVVLAALLAALTWQLRFLPALLMLLLSIIGLTAWQRHRDERLVLVALTVAVPAVAALLTYAWAAPGIVAAVRAAEWSTAVLLAVPPALALLLTGPVPARFARLATHWPAVGAALLAPFAIGVVFLRAPILPNAAVEVAAGDGPPAVLNGHIVTVDDTTTTLLDRAGRVRFLPNGEVRSKTLCPEAAQAPATVVLVRGWHVEQSALEWIAPSRRPEPPDPRCQGRPGTP
jgi:hypothetical protein